MVVYTSGGEIYCEDCGRDMLAAYVSDLRRQGKRVSHYEDDAPVSGPHSDGGGEADCPQHCGACGTFLENPLTPEGEEYVREVLRKRTGNSEVLTEWADYYGFHYASDPFAGQFMQPETYHGHFQLIRDTYEGDVVCPEEYAQYACRRAAAEAYNVPQDNVETVFGWGGRLSAPGYLDATDWIFIEGATEQDVLAELINLYG